MTQLGKVRISVANLVGRVFISSVSEFRHVGILNPTRFNRDGAKLFQAIGGGAELSEAGRAVLQRKFGANKFEGNDARFEVLECYEDAVLRLIAELSFDFRDRNIERELAEELGHEELKDIPPIFTEDEVRSTAVLYRKTVRQPAPYDGVGSSPNARAGVPTRRLFNLFDLVLTPALFAKLIASPAIREFSDAEVATTHGGSRKGITTDGFAIADNIAFW